MDLRRLEVRCHRLIDRVTGGARIEDHLVECKAEWPADAHGAARRIAAHANSARGEPILWLIGLDEDAGQVRPLDQTDLANWWPAVAKHFTEGVAPELTHLQVHTERGTVAALWFRTDRSPYVVSVAEPGKAVDREVPWRDGTRTRTAKRSELLSLLVEAAEVPEAELLEAYVQADVATSASPDATGGMQAKRTVELSFHARVFLDSSRPTVVPQHKCALSLAFGGGPDLQLTPSFRAHGPDISAADRITVGGVAVLISGIHIHGPDLLQIDSHVSLDSAFERGIRDASDILLGLRLPVNRTNRALSVNESLTWVSGEKSTAESPVRRALGRWQWQPD